MPQDSSTEPDTRRLLPDGSIGRARPVLPRPAGSRTPPRADDRVPVAAPQLPAAGWPDAGSDSTVTIPPVPEVEPTAAAPEPPVVGRSDAGSDSTVAIPPVPAADSPLTGPDDTVTYRTDGPQPGPHPALQSTAGGAGPGGPAGPDDADGPDRPWWRRRAVFLPAAAVLTLGAVYGVDLLAAGDDVPRGTVVAGVDLGGLSRSAAAGRLTTELAPRMAADRTLLAGDVRGVLHPLAAGIALDVPRTVDIATDKPLNPWTRLRTLVGDRDVEPVLTTDDVAMAAQLEEFATTVDRPAVDATIALDGTTPTVVQPVDGRAVDRDGAATAVTAALVNGADPSTPIDVPVAGTPFRVGAAEAQRVLDQTVTPALSAPVTVGPAGADPVEVPVSAIASSLTFTPAEDGTLAVAIDPAALQNSMGRQFAAFGTPARDARFQISGGAVTVVPSVDGQGINPTELAGQLLPVLDDPAPRSVTANLGLVPAAFTTEQARALGITEQVSSFSTHFTNSASGTNIRVVAEEVDGAVVRPGETFSLNGYTGPRGTAQGYVPAAVISGGELSQAVGGGISQFATTMFNAVFFAGLEDVHHKPHSFYISRYPAGREATVYEGQIDLQWRNDTNTGIYVQAEWVPGTITVTLWGKKHYDIGSVSGERRNIRQPAVQEKVDTGNCTPQSGSQGFDITVTRVFKDPATGAELRRQDFNTHYAAEAVIHCVPAPAPAPAPASAPPTDAPASTPPAAPSTPAGRRAGHRRTGRVCGRARPSS
jgi:vancomycin resistance protein YoaR